MLFNSYSFLFGFLPLTFVFAAAQVPLLMKYAEPETGEK